MPEEILSLICKTTEDFSRDHTAFSRKYAKNITVLILSQVCRTWRFRISTNASLWKDIAFDVCDHQSVKLAHHSLDVMEKTDALFSVYARLHGDPRPAVRIFSRLQLLIGRVVHFEYFGELGECGRYLDRPAENLLHLSGPLDLDSQMTTIFSKPIFAGQVPRLRSMAMPSAIQCAGWATPLSTLTDLELVPPHLGHTIPIVSLFNLFSGLPALKRLKLSGFGVIDDVGYELQQAYLPHLEILDLNQSDIQTLLNHIHTPNLQKTTFYGSSYPPGYAVLAPAFRTPHFFAGFSFPVLEQEINEVFVMAEGDGGDKRFWMQLVSSSGCSLDVRMCWPKMISQEWKGYVERSVVALERRMVLSPGARASFDFQSSFFRLFLGPFLSTKIRWLTINCGLVEELCSSFAAAATTLPYLETVEVVDVILARDQVVGALGSHSRARGINLVVYDTRGPLPSSDSFDMLDIGYIMSHSVSLLAEALSEM